MLKHFGTSERDKLTYLADSLFRMYIKITGKFICVRCHKRHPQKIDSQTLDCSHFWNRRYLKVRWVPENADPLCRIPCHDLWEKKDRKEYTAYKKKQLGEKGFEDLKIKAQSTSYKLTNPDIAAIIYNYQLLLGMKDKDL
jgi:hypothetical protein